MQDSTNGTHVDNTGLRRMLFVLDLENPRIDGYISTNMILVRHYALINYIINLTHISIVKDMLYDS